MKLTSVRRLSAACSLVTLLVCCHGPALGQEAAPVTAEEYLARQDASIAEVEQQLETSPDSAALWQQLVMLRSMRFSMLRNSAGTPASQEESREFSLALIDEWIAAQPNAAEPYVARSNVLPQEERTPYLLSLREALGENLLYQERLLRALTYDGEHATASLVIDDLLNKDPGREQFALVHQFLSDSNRGARLDEVIEQWLVGHPEDPAAHRALLQRQAKRGDSAEAVRDNAQRAVGTFDGTNFTEALRLCRALSRGSRESDLDDIVESCYAKVLAGDLEDEQLGRALEGMAVFLAGRGRGNEASAILYQISPERRGTVINQLMNAEVAAGRCGEAIYLSRQHGTAGSTAGVALAQLFADCGATPEHQTELAARAANLDEEGTRYLLDRWSTRTDLQPAIELAQRYLEEDPSSRTIWRALDQLLARNQNVALREEHLNRWLASPAGDAGSAEIKQLADLLLTTGRTEESIALLRQGLEQAEAGSRDYLLGPLAEALLQSGSWDAAAAAIEELTLSSREYWQARARYLAAQSAWIQGNETLALSELESYLEVAKSPDEEAISAYVGLASNLRLDDEVADALKRIYSKLHRLGTASGSFEAWAAEQFERAGLLQLARPYLEAALAEAPGDAKLLRALARVDSFTGQSTGVPHLRQSLETDPHNATSWRLLVSKQFEAGDVEGALAILEEAYALFPTPPQSLKIEEARIRLSQEAYLEVVRLLRPIARKNVYATTAVKMLRQAYRHLGSDQ